MMIDKICPVMTIGLAARKQGLIAGCRDNCAWYNSGTDQCAVFGIFDQVSDVAQRVDELRDVIEDGVKVFKVNE